MSPTPPPPSEREVEAALRPCPFCGGHASYGEVRTGPHDPNDGGWYIACDGCGASTNLVFPLKEDVRAVLAEKWNRRRATRAAPSNAGEAAVWNEAIEAAAKAAHEVWLDAVGQEDGPEAASARRPVSIERHKATLARIRALRRNAGEARTVEPGDCECCVRCYAEGARDGRAAGPAELDLLREVAAACANPELDDPRLDYVTVQIDRALVEKIRAGGCGEPEGDPNDHVLALLRAARATIESDRSETLYSALIKAGGEPGHPHLRTAERLLDRVPLWATQAFVLDQAIALRRGESKEE